MVSLTLCPVFDSCQIMRTRISVLLLTAFLAPAGVAQDKVRDKPKSGTSETTQHKAEEVQRKAQAIDILKGVVEGAADIPEARTRVIVLSAALDLLWKHDEAYARANFIKSAAALSDKFTSESTQKSERAEIRAAIGALLRAFGRHDVQAAARLLDKFQNLLEGTSKDNLSPSERLALAHASLDTDAVQSAALAAKVLEAGVPGTFPSYLNELEQRDAATATALFRTALALLAGNRIHSPTHATILSTYIFRESYMSIPEAYEGRDGSIEFGTFASPLSPPNRELNRELAAAYLNASGAYLHAQANLIEQLGDPDPHRVGLTFFLVKKLVGYAQRLGLDGGQNWAAIDAKFTILAERARLGEQALSGLTTVAQRIVTENSVFRFDGGEAAFAAAEKTKDPAQRQELLIAGIRQLIEEDKYAEAVQKIADLRDDKFRDQLNTYLSFRMAETSLKKSDWDNFNAQINRVSSPRLRTYLLLSAALAAREAKKRKMSSEFLLTAMASFSKIEELDARAAALVATTGILYETADASWTAQVLTEGVNAINRANKYDGKVYGVMIEMSKWQVWRPLAKFDLSYCFEQTAKRDWTDALAAAQSIESKVLRSHAYIAACRAVL